MLEALALVISAGCGLAAIVLLALQLRRARREARALRDEVQALRASTALENVRELNVLVETVRLERGQWRAAAIGEKERADNFFSMIHAATTQRDGWSKLYHDCCAGFSRTQDALLREIARLSRIAGVPAAPHLEPMVAEFRGQHPRKPPEPPAPVIAPELPPTEPAK